MATRQLIMTVAAVLAALAPALAQSLAQTTKQPEANPAVSSDGVRKPDQAQPQGPTGPLETGTGGAAASSPQGETPAAMQPRPQEPAEATGRGTPSEKKD